MIKNETAYKKALNALKEDQKVIQARKLQFSEQNLNEDQIEQLLQPLISFNEQLKSEVEYYERIKRGNFNSVLNLTDMGKLLIAYRIYLNMSQAELANKLGVSEAQVSRDERHEYYGATTEKIEKVKEAMGMRTKTSIELPV